jgi:hypothetical protein
MTCAERLVDGLAVRPGAWIEWTTAWRIHRSESLVGRPHVSPVRKSGSQAASRTSNLLKRSPGYVKVALGGSITENFSISHLPHLLTATIRPWDCATPSQALPTPHAAGALCACPGYLNRIAKPGRAGHRPKTPETLGTGVGTPIQLRAVGEMSTRTNVPPFFEGCEGD